LDLQKETYRSEDKIKKFQEQELVEIETQEKKIEFLEKIEETIPCEIIESNVEQKEIQVKDFIEKIEPTYDKTNREIEQEIKELDLEITLKTNISNQKHGKDMCKRRKSYVNKKKMRKTKKLKENQTSKKICDNICNHNKYEKYNSGNYIKKKKKKNEAIQPTNEEIT